MMKAKWETTPSIYEINTRVWLKELSNRYERELDLSCIPEEEYETLQRYKLDAVWLMGVWEPSEISRKVAAAHEGLRTEFYRALPDLKEEDIGASPYAVKSYKVNPALGGEKGLAKCRKELASRGIKLILDFVPNHTGRDHHWIKSNPDFYIQGEDWELEEQPQNFFRVENSDLILAHGRDPYFSGWTDTAQLNYFNPELRRAATDQIIAISKLCDGIRCDMAMLIMNEIHNQVWGYKNGQNLEMEHLPEFWIEAIKAVKKVAPNFIFIAEAYWMKEGPLQEMGFDFTYDKAVYDYIKDGNVSELKRYLSAVSFGYQTHSIRFLENHDEDRAANSMYRAQNKSGALMIASMPGAVLWHEGEFEGLQTKTPVQLLRRREECTDEDLKAYFNKLLEITGDSAFKNGDKILCHPRSACNGIFLYENFIIYIIREEKQLLLSIVNFAPVTSQCYVALPAPELENKKVLLKDLLGSEVYKRDGNTLLSEGLYLELPAWGRNLFQISTI